MAEYQLPESAVAFKSDDGQVVVVSNPLGCGIFHSSDGTHFTQCFSTGASMGGDLSSFEGDCVDVASPSFGYRFECTGDQLTFNKVAYTKTRLPEKIEYEPLPTTRRHQFLYRLEDGRYCYASSAVFNKFWPMNGWRIYLGTGDAMQAFERAKIMTETRFIELQRIETIDGTLYLHIGRDTPRDQGLWLPTGCDKEDGVPAIAQKYDDYDIEETNDGVVITTKSAASV